MPPLRPCQFYILAPEGHPLGEQLCGLPQTHRLTIGSMASVWHLDACTLHFAAMYVLTRYVTGNYLDFICLHEGKTHGSSNT